MTEKQVDIKQVCFKLETELDMKNDELREAINLLAPEGKLISVKRGNSIWEVVSIGAAHSHYYIGCFRGMTRTGKVHFFSYKQII